MLQPKKVINKKLDTFLKSSFKKELKNQKQDESNRFKSNYIPTSNKYKKQLQERINNTPQLKQDNSTEKDKKFNKNYHDKKEWDNKKWGVYENIATTAELGNFVPHPVAQAVGKAGSIASVALSARKAKLAYDNQDYVNMGLNLGMMGLSGKMGSTTFAKNTVKSKNLDSFEKLIAPKEFKSNIVNGYEIGRMETQVPSYINILNKKSGQNTLDLAKNRALLGVVGVDYSTDFNLKQNQKAQGGYVNNNSQNNINMQTNNKQLINQFKLPLYVQSKSFADASKAISDKFKGRNDMISNNTKNELLKRLAEAQEYSKSQEQQVQQEQMAMGGYTNQYEGGGFENSTVGQAFGDEATKEQKSAAIGAGVNTLVSGIDLAKTAFGNSNIDTSGQTASTEINSEAMIGGSALKGAQAGMAFGPVGAGVGALVGGVAGILGANKAKKAMNENTSNFTTVANRRLSDNYFAMGGEINKFDGGGPFPENYKDLNILNNYGEDPKNIQSIQDYKKLGYHNYKIGDADLNNVVNDKDVLKKESTKTNSLEFLKNNSDLLRYSPAIANALQLKNLKKPTNVTLNKLSNKYRPDYVDLAQQQNIVNQELNNVNSAIQQSGASQGAIRNAMLSAQLNKTKALSNAYMNAEQQNAQQNATAQQFNLGVDQVNLQQSNSQQDINDRNIGAYDTQKSQLISQIGNDLGGIGTEQLRKQMPGKMGLYFDYNGNPINGAYKDKEGNTFNKEGVMIYDKNNKEIVQKAKGGYLETLNTINTMYNKRNSK